MPALLSQLVQVRSQAAEAMIDWLMAEEQKLSGNTLLDRFGRKLDDLLVPLRVEPYDRSFQDLDAMRARERCRATGYSDNGDDPEKGQRQVFAFRGSRSDEDSPSRPRPEPLNRIAPNLDLAVLLGDPGSGKTEWLKGRAKTATNDAREKLEKFECDLDDICFPVFMRLPSIAAELKNEKQLRRLLAQTSCVVPRPASLTDAERIAAAMLSSLIKHRQLPKTLAPFVWKRLTASVGSNRPILFLDAWDEVRSGQTDLARCLNAYAGAANTRMFLTSRIVGYTLRPLPVENKSEGRRRELLICPFTWNETSEFVKGFFGDDRECGQKMLGELRSKISISGMAQNPLLATLLCMAFSPLPRREPLGFPARRVDVYKRVLVGLLGEWEAVTKKQEALDRDGQSDDDATAPDWDLIYAKLKLLEEMAYHFFPDEELSAEKIHNFLRDERNGYIPKLDINDPLRRIANPIAELCQDGVLVPSGEGADSYLFMHLTFQEYMVGSCIARRANESEVGWRSIAALIDENALRPIWDEVIVMLAGQLNDPIPLLELLEDAGLDDYFRHRLCLAVRCLPELPGRGVPEAGSEACKVLNAVKRLAGTVFNLWWEGKQGYDFPHVDRCLPTIARISNTIVALWELPEKPQYLVILEHR